jgi:hypothetical protein
MTINNMIDKLFIAYSTTASEGVVVANLTDTMFPIGFNGIGTSWWSPEQFFDSILSDDYILIHKKGTKEEIEPLDTALYGRRPNVSLQ